MSLKQFAAILGFAFVAAWIGFDFGSAILCLLGAGAFAASSAIITGDLDLADVQGRLQGVAQPSPPPPPSYVPPPPRPAASRVR